MFPTPYPLASFRNAQILAQPPNYFNSEIIEHSRDLTLKIINLRNAFILLNSNSRALDMQCLGARDMLRDLEFAASNNNLGQTMTIALKLVKNISKMCGLALRSDSRYNVSQRFHNEAETLLRSMLTRINEQLPDNGILFIQGRSL